MTSFFEANFQTLTEKSGLPEKKSKIKRDIDF